MTVQPSQGHEPRDTPPEEIDRLIAARGGGAGRGARRISVSTDCRVS